jgi:hypothetical protein
MRDLKPSNRRLLEFQLETDLQLRDYATTV